MAMTPWTRRALWAGATLAGLAGLALTAVAAGLVLSEHRAQRRISLPVQAMDIPTGPAVLARGRYLFASRGCADCHGADGAGHLFVDGGPDLQLAGPAIARAAGQGSSAADSYRPADWVRTLRHGVKPDGRPVRVMPSEDYNRLTDADLGALVAYVQSLPPVPAREAVIVLPLPARVLYGLGLLQDAVEKIDHRLPPQAPVDEGVSIAHGRYVASMCLGCHGPQLAGGDIPGAPPDWPAAARLAGPGNVMEAAYADPEVFVRMLKSGQRADGSAIRVMPFAALSQLNDTDARALHLYLTTAAAAH
jgi:mono/diheme cytochrome c family protein